MSNRLAVYFYMGHMEGIQAWPGRVRGLWTALILKTALRWNNSCSWQPCPSLSERYPGRDPCKETYLACFYSLFQKTRTWVPAPCMFGWFLNHNGFFLPRIHPLSLKILLLSGLSSGFLTLKWDNIRVVQWMLGVSLSNTGWPAETRRMSKVSVTGHWTICPWVILMGI